MLAIKTKLLIESLDDESLAAVPTLTVKGARCDAHYIYKYGYFTTVSGRFLGGMVLMISS